MYFCCHVQPDVVVVETGLSETGVVQCNHGVTFAATYANTGESSLCKHNKQRPRILVISPTTFAICTLIKLKKDYCLCIRQKLMWNFKANAVKFPVHQSHIPVKKLWTFPYFMRKIPSTPSVLKNCSNFLFIVWFFHSRWVKQWL